MVTSAHPTARSRRQVYQKTRDTIPGGDCRRVLPQSRSPTRETSYGACHVIILESRHRFMTEIEDQLASALVVTNSFDSAITGAQLVTLATKATVPILFSRHLIPGGHVTSVEPPSRDRVEVEPGPFPAFDRIACDSVHLVMDQAGDHPAVAQGYGPKRAGELAAVVTGTKPRRQAPTDGTLCTAGGGRPGREGCCPLAASGHRGRDGGVEPSPSSFSIKAVPPEWRRRITWPPPT